METRQIVGIVILGVVVVGGGILLYSRSKKTVPAAPAGPAMPETTSWETGVSADDQATYQAIKQTYQSKMGTPVPDWFLEYAKTLFDSNNLRHNDYLVGGKVTKSGALMSAIAISYKDASKGADAEANGATWDVFRAFRKKMLSL